MEIIDSGLIKNERVFEILDDMRYGFNLNFDFKNGHSDVKIIFDLLLPFDKLEHQIVKTGTAFRVYFLDKTTLPQSVDLLTELVQISMAHTRLFMMINNPDMRHIPMRFFIREHFKKEIMEQLNTLGLITN